MTSDSVASALSYDLPNSYVIAEDAGLYPTRRLPSTLGLNYNIQDVKFKTNIAPSQTHGPTSVVSGDMTILEPFGLSFIDAIVAASFNGQTFDSWTDRPFLLELNFHGYDDTGTAMSGQLLPLYRKRFPIRITTVRVSTNARGSEYKISFVAANQEAYFKKYGFLPQDLHLQGTNIQEVLNDLANQLNAFYQAQTTAAQGTSAFSDSYAFVIDPALGVNNILSGDGKSSLMQLANDGTNINGNVFKFDFSAHTSIVDVIGKVMARGGFFQNQLNSQTGTIIPNQPLNTYKILSQTIYSGTDSSGNSLGPVFNYRQGVFARKITYVINQYVSWQNNHPNSPSLYADSTPYTCKTYNYTYSGRNTDVIDFKLEFNNTWYTNVMTYTQVTPANTPSPVTGSDILSEESPPITPAGTIALLNIPSVLARLPGMTQVPNPTPQAIRPVTNNQNITTGAGIIQDSLAQQVADVHYALYTFNTGQMSVVPLTIMGDPTLIKQDDWLYVPMSTVFSGAGDYNDALLNNSDFAAKYGHLRMSLSEVPVTLTVNSILDQDTEINNTGLAWNFPESTPSTAIFSGQYNIVEIDNIFANGKFTQVLHLTRYLNGSVASQASLVSDRARQPQIDLNTVFLNNAQVTGSVPLIPTGR
jgi:hypothetical protein